MTAVPFEDAGPYRPRPESRRETVSAMLAALERARATSAAEAWALLRREFPFAPLEERAAAISRWSAE